MPINVELLRDWSLAAPHDNPDGSRIVLWRYCPDDYALLDELDLPDPGDLAYPYLGRLDPYGTTIFSTPQMEVVIEEFERLQALKGSVNLAAALALARRTKAEAAWLGFFGD